MNCVDDPAQLFQNGEWMDAIYCWLTSGGDPTLTIVIPTVIYGTILLGMFIVGQSPIMPVVTSIILAGVIFAAFPANAVTIVLVTIIMMMSIGATLMTRRLGR